MTSPHTLNKQGGKGSMDAQIVGTQALMRMIRIAHRMIIFKRPQSMQGNPLSS